MNIHRAVVDIALTAVDKPRNTYVHVAEETTLLSLDGHGKGKPSCCSNARAGTHVIHPQSMCTR